MHDIFISKMAHWSETSDPNLGSILSASASKTARPTVGIALNKKAFFFGYMMTSFKYRKSSQEISPNLEYETYLWMIIIERTSGKIG